MPVFQMLERRKYTRAELIELFHTDRIDSIKGKLNRRGYKYITSGRGNTFELTITQLPPHFRNFCIDELGFAPQTDFKKLKKFLYRFYLDEKYMQLPTTTMARELADEMSITDDTINRWIHKMIESNIIYRCSDEFNYYSFSKDKDGNIITNEIDKQTYSDAWKSYWEAREYGYNEALCCLNAVAGGQPHKVGVILGNAFTVDKVNRLIEILREEIDLDE